MDDKLERIFSENGKQKLENAMLVARKLLEIADDFPELEKEYVDLKETLSAIERKLNDFESEEKEPYLLFFYILDKSLNDFYTKFKELSKNQQ